VAERPGRRLAVAALVVLLALAAGAAGWTYLAEREVSRGISTHNPRGGEGTALVVYHPGLSGYVTDMVTAYAEGLAGRGWRVETTTASPEAPENLDSYDLLVVAAPTYWWTPALPVRRYVERIAPLNDRPVAVLVTASVQVERATRLLESQVELRAGG